MTKMGRGPGLAGFRFKIGKGDIAATAMAGRVPTDKFWILACAHRNNRID